MVSARRFAAIVLGLLLLGASASAQDLDPRAYAKVPVGFTFAVAGFGYSRGGVVTDPTLPVQNVRADVETPSLGVGHSFGLFGRTAQALVALPYSWARVSGDVGEQAQHINRSGLADVRLRLSVLLAGAPAMTLQEFAKSPRRPIVGTSLTVVAPTGQYYPERLVNLGTNRWSFKPEMALSYPLGRRWLVDVYAALWLFTSNGSYYPGTMDRTQAPIGALQTHVSYSLSPKAWAAFDATWYGGGQASVNGVRSGVRQSNSRVGVTFAFPVGRRHGIKVAWSTGAIIRSGADFRTISVGWQTGWLTRPPAKP
jgi:hypothetical protein